MKTVFGLDLGTQVQLPIPNTGSNSLSLNISDSSHNAVGRSNGGTTDDFQVNIDAPPATIIVEIGMADCLVPHCFSVLAKIDNSARLTMTLAQVPRLPCYDPVSTEHSIFAPENNEEPRTVLAACELQRFVISCVH